MLKSVRRLCYVHNIDTFNAMSKGSKDYVMLKQGTYTSLLITFFSHQMLCMLKHVEGVKGQDNF